MLSILPVSVALNQEVETILEDEIGETDITSRYNESEWMEQLAPERASKVIETVSSLINVLKANPENLNEMKTALISLNKNVAQFNSGIESPDSGLEVDNSTSGESYSTLPMNEDMSGSLEMITEVIN
jgi:hypothetical protein